MRVIIAGSRTFTERGEIERGIQAALKSWGITAGALTLVMTGGCRGVDRTGETWAAQRGIPSRVFMPNWSENGKAAGPIRNEKMARGADALIAIWDGASPGTRDMIQRANDHGLRVYVHTVSTEAKRSA